MKKQTPIQRIWQDESGATAIEYGLVCGIMAVALAAVMGVGGALDGIYDRMDDLIDAIAGE